MSRFAIRAGLALLCLCLVHLESCSDRRTKISSVLSNPRGYEGQQITIEGTASEAVSFMGYGGFRVRDETGEIFVVTNRAVPQKGQKIRVVGSARQLISFGGVSVVIFFEQELPKPK